MSAVLGVAMFVCLFVCLFVCVFFSFFLSFFKSSTIQACLYVSARIVYDFVTCSFICFFFARRRFGLATKYSFCNVCIIFCGNCRVKSVYYATLNSTRSLIFL